MVAREPGEFGGEYYRLMPEGTLTNCDGLTVNVNRDREGLDLNRNFPTHVAPGVRAGRRRPLPDQRARGAGDGGLHRRAAATSARR